MFMKLKLLFMLMTALGILCVAGLVFAVQRDDDSAQDDLKSQSSEDGRGRDIRSDSLDVHDSSETWDSHSASTDCAQCHGNRPERTSRDTVKLVAPVPRLCSTCHNQYASLDGWVHGPTAAGDCLFCHDPHESKYGSLLTKPVPELCYACHTTETLGLIAGHSDESYGRCKTCHDSHVGTNRELLKQSFLDSELGASYNDEVAYRRPQYTFVDRRSSLAGLRGIRVITTIERQDLLSRYGLTPEIVKTEVERCLRQEGVRILSDEGQPGLYAFLRLVEVRFPGYSNEVCALSGTLDISLRQTVELVFQPSDAERRICLASTWDTSAVVVWGIPKIREGLNNAIEVLVEKFCSDYLVANPSDKQPMPGQDASENYERRTK